MPNVKDSSIALDGKITFELDDGSIKIVDLANLNTGPGSVTVDSITDAGTDGKNVLKATSIKTVGGQSIIGAGDITVAAVGKDPVTLIGTSYLLTFTDHANCLLICTNSQPITLTIQSDAAGGFAKDDSISVYQAGAGTVTISGDLPNGVNLRQPPGTIASTSGQYRLASALRVNTNEWVCTESAGATINGLEQFVVNDFGALLVESNTINALTSIGLRASNQTTIDSSTAGGGTAINSTSEVSTNKRRVKYTAAAAAAGRGAGIVQGAVKLNPIDSGDYNGRFPFCIAGSIEDASPATGIVMIGAMTNPPAGTLTTLAANPNGMIAVGFDEGDTNWQLFYRSAASGAVTKIDLGSNFTRVTGEVITLNVDKFTTGTAGTFRFVATIRNLARKQTSYQTFTTTMPWSLDAAWFRGSATSSTQVAVGVGGFVCGRVMV